ncbi:MAG: helix-turn-helix domain-containing protein [Acidobacteriaceae bacterium]|nr:helix-turn-helix domain-containing protein [Acidobacteriaceae bacterium]
MNKFCDDLRAERERRNVTLETICGITKISSQHIRALEAGRYAELPGGIFRKSIVRSYLEVLGLEQSPWISRFEASLRESGVAEEDKDWVEFAENVRKNRGASVRSLAPRWIGVALMAAALVAIGWVLWTRVLYRLVS